MASAIFSLTIVAEIGRYADDSAFATVMISGAMPKVSQPNMLPVRPKPRDHLVGDEQDVVAAQHLLHAGKVAVRRHDHAARALHRLGDEGSDRVGTSRLISASSCRPPIGEAASLSPGWP